MNTVQLSASTRHRWTRTDVMVVMAYVLLLVGYVINAIDRISFPVFIPNIRAEYGLSLSTSGLISTISYLGMGLFGIPIGYLLDRMSRKHIFNLGLFIFSLATILTVASQSIWDMALYRVASGVGESMQLTALLAIAGALFSRYRGLAIGGANTAFAIGSFIGPALGGLLLTTYHSWRVPLIIFGVVGIVMCIVTYAFVPSRLVDRKTSASERVAEVRVEGGSPHMLNRNSLLLIPVAALGGLITFGFLGMYPTFLRTHLGFTAEQAGILLALHGIGALVSFLGGALGDRFSPRVVMVSAFLCTAVIGVLMFGGPTTFGAQAILSFALGVTYSGVVYTNTAAYLVKSVRQELAGIASGTFMVALYVPAAFAGMTVGAMAARWGWTVAGIVETSVFAVIGAVLCVLLDPSQFSRAATAKTA